MLSEAELPKTKPWAGHHTHSPFPPSLPNCPSPSLQKKSILLTLSESYYGPLPPKYEFFKVTKGQYEICMSSEPLLIKTWGCFSVAYFACFQDGKKLHIDLTAQLSTTGRRGTWLLSSSKILSRRRESKFLKLLPEHRLAKGNYSAWGHCEFALMWILSQ